MDRGARPATMRGVRVGHDEAAERSECGHRREEDGGHVTGTRLHWDLNPAPTPQGLYS